MIYEVRYFKYNQLTQFQITQSKNVQNKIIAFLYAANFFLRERKCNETKVAEE
jgi:hypothetical protein